MRLFAALDLSDEVRDEIAAWWTAAGIVLPAGEWRDVAKRNWHLTLAFYGEVGGDELDDLAEMLADVAAQASPFLLQTGDCGVFPTSARPRVFWMGAGVGDGMGEQAGSTGRELKHLARCCRQAGHVTLRKHTAKSELFRGHITLARAIPEASPLQAEIWQSLPELQVQTWTADTLCLYASELRPHGPLYRLVEAFEFKG